MKKLKGFIKNPDGTFKAVMLKAIPSGASDGLYKLVVDANVTVGSLNLGIVDADGDLAAVHPDGNFVEATVDGYGHLWIAGRDLIDAIKKAGDCVQTVTSRNGANQPLTIDYVSARWRTLLTSGTLKVTDTLTYLVTGEWDTLTPSLTP